ncbi:hypothetical protein [Amycolatopsis sp.]|uniref:hypothetical protein n=1 Tax=Amycolatopsis sp. TaxID=37632 RepID=UPI002C0CD0E1|nr:hypothetical protein [Amycolatopsis sp.]HVV08936.1 hypothetical protein [Amycolatopsis sp.]
MSAENGEGILQILRIRAQAAPPQLAEALGADEAEIRAGLAKLAEQGSVRDTGDARQGWTTTRAGRRTAEDRMKTLSEGSQPQLTKAFEAFLVLDGEFEELCADWRTRDAIKTGAAEFAPRLASIDDGARAVLEEIVPIAKHFALYAPRLARAREKFTGGTDSYLTGLTVDSYRTIWTEWHECFSVSLGKPGESSGASTLG